jgi:hypothetical protein
MEVGSRASFCPTPLRRRVPTITARASDVRRMAVTVSISVVCARSVISHTITAGCLISGDQGRKDPV